MLDAQILALPRGAVGAWLQGRYRDLWQECARRAFEQIDTDGSGYIEREELVAYLSNKLSPYEVCRLFCNIHYPATWLPLCLLRHMPSCGPAYLL